VELVTENDPKNRPNVLDRLRRAGIEKVTSEYSKPIGRLYMNTEGLLLFTTYGTFSRHMELPSTVVHYIVPYGYMDY
jgi:16S rRNA U516 pseudouridylate synthase RsuA-like enzyme